jgi:hypothetical protein
MWFMSRIITSNYIEKLNEVIDEFDSSPKLNFLVDFFIEEVEKDQNRKGNRNQKNFSSNNLEKLNEIKNSDELKKIFAYINIIIYTFSNQYLHIHINTDLSENISDNLITLFTWRALAESLYDNDLIENEIKTLKTETSRDLIMPNDNNGHVTNQIFRRRHGLKHRLRFVEKIKNKINDTTSSGILININASAFDFVNLSDFSEFPDSLNTFVNFGYGRKDIFKEMGREKVERLSTIVNLFPSITGKNIWYKDFLSDEINRYNNFKKVITITSGEKTPEALLEMRRQKKFLAEEIYTIFSFEL